MGVIGHIDPFAALAGPSASVDAPDAAVVGDLEIRAARAGVVRIQGIACGLGVEGSGWIVAPGLVVTNAHVVAGMNRPRIDFGDGRPGVSSSIVAFDVSADIAVLSAPALGGRPLPIGRADSGTPAALLGFPEGGPYRAVAVRVAKDVTFIARNALGEGLYPRRVTGVRGLVRHGNSGGPVVDADGRVVTVIFAERKGPGAPSGYGVTIDEVSKVIASVGQPVDTPCGHG
jgi:S1-C subfamily serine protease